MYNFLASGMSKRVQKQKTIHAFLLVLADITLFLWFHYFWMENSCIRFCCCLTVRVCIRSLKISCAVHACVLPFAGRDCISRKFGESLQQFRCAFSCAALFEKLSLCFAV